MTLLNHLYLLSFLLFDYALIKKITNELFAMDKIILMSEKNDLSASEISYSKIKLAKLLFLGDVDIGII